MRGHGGPRRGLRVSGCAQLPPAPPSPYRGGAVRTCHAPELNERPACAPPPAPGALFLPQTQPKIPQMDSMPFGCVPFRFADVARYFEEIVDYSQFEVRVPEWDAEAVPGAVARAVENIEELHRQTVCACEVTSRAQRRSGGGPLLACAKPHRFSPAEAQAAMPPAARVGVAAGYA